MLRELWSTLKGVTRESSTEVVNPPDDKKVPDPAPPRRKKIYVAPAMRKVDPEMAKLILVAKAWDGDQEARRLLELIFAEGGEKILPPKAS
jgi:hypothetical protein